jgi:putative tricarboxylic transport membrane protein
MLKADRILAGCIALVAIAYLYGTFQIREIAIGGPVGPRAFPMLLGAALLLAAALLVAETFAKSYAAAPLDLPGLKSIAGTLLWLGCYAAVFEWLGYLIATTIFLIVLMAVLHPRHWVANIVTAILFAIASYALFDKVLGARLATGLLSF